MRTGRCPFLLGHRRQVKRVSNRWYYPRVASARANPQEMIDRQVGRYHIVRHLASGGMAELYIARQEAMGGFEKEIVLKMLQGRYAENRRVVSMFLDEARLAAKLNHPSIVHVYDVADEDGVKYIAMVTRPGASPAEIRSPVARFPIWS